MGHTSPVLAFKAASDAAPELSAVLGAVKFLYAFEPVCFYMLARTVVCSDERLPSEMVAPIRRFIKEWDE